MDTRAVVARFETERQALALMEHPNIAKVFDAGATPEERPYFAMEYVPGLAITAYCDKHRLNIYSGQTSYLSIGPYRLVERIELRVLLSEASVIRSRFGKQALFIKIIVGNDELERCEKSSLPS